MSGMDTGEKMIRRKMPESLLLFGIVLLFALLALFLQGIPALAAIPEEWKRGTSTVLLLVLPLVVLYGMATGKISERRMVFLIVCLSMLFHCSYCVLSGLYERQHDLGVYTGIGDDQVNPGHLGYIEFIYKFRKLPKINPYELFSYYHPPLHYLISGLWVIFLTGCGMAEELAFENLQVLTLLYSGLFLLVCLKILKLLDASGKGLYAALLLCALHPSLMFLSGSVNNDMLCTLLIACCIWACLAWIRKKTLPRLLALALAIGLGMLSKVNTAVIAFPVGLTFLLDFAGVLFESRRTGKQAVWKALRSYILFGLVSGVVGLAWIVRNLVLFSELPGVPAPANDSVMSVRAYSLWERLGIPSLADWNFPFPFHGISSEYCHNNWVIMFRTSLFAEEFPAGIPAVPLILCQAAYILAILFGTAAAVLFLSLQLKKVLKARKEAAGGQKGALLRSPLFQEGCFLGAGYLAFLLGFAVFTIKYPYTCSSDFRYIVICLLYTGIGMAESFRLLKGRISARAAGVIRAGACAATVLAAVSVWVIVVWRWW